MVTAIVNDPSLVAGQVLDWTGCITFVGKKTTGAVARGDLMVPDTSTAPDSWKVAPASASQTGPFAVAMQDAASADTEVHLAQGGVIALTADGTIEINKLVQNATSTAGQVIQFVSYTGTTGSEAAIDFNHVVGECLGFADNFWTTAPTAPVDGDLAAIKLRIT